MKKRRNNSRKLINRRSLIFLIITALLLVGIFIVLRPAKKTTSTIPSTNPSRSNVTSQNTSNQQPAGSSAQPSNTTSNSGTTDKTQVSAPAADGTLVAPYGVFVSNHAPGQNGSGTSEVSTCTTTPGAQCYIKFTNGNETKLLDSRTTDSSGTAYWSWDTANPKLSAGDWQITAVATLNGQTKTSQDDRALTIR